MKSPRGIARASGYRESVLLRLLEVASVQERGRAAEMSCGIIASGHLDTVTHDVSVVGRGNARFRSRGSRGHDLDRIEVLGDGTGSDFETSPRALRAERQLPGLYVPRDR